MLILLLAWIFTPRHRFDVNTVKNIDLPPEASEVIKVDPELSAKWVDVIVSSGDSLSKIFKYNNFRSDQLYALLNAPKSKQILTNLTPGNHIRFLVDEHGNILQAIYKPNTLTQLKVTRNKNIFSEKVEKLPIENRQTYCHGVIKASLFNAGLRANLPSKLIMQLVDIFQWDIDFAKDIRPGDHFSVLFDQKYVNGEPVAYGDIIAAEFSNRGKTYQAIRYESSNGQIGYYNKDGHSMKRRFIRTPVKFTRISSYFKPKRWHPLLHRFRKHTGVDYAAPSGTPIKATGHGKIKFRGRKGGYGNAVIIDHGNGYTTLYGHMLRFAKNKVKGTKVKQGDIIGYVGMTGLATGPHCHYEFRINNKHRDPLKVQLPQGHTIAKNQRKQFLAYSNSLLKRIALYDQIEMAALRKPRTISTSEQT